MMRRWVLGCLLLALAACAAVPAEQDGGIGGTGAPVAQVVVN